MMPCPAKNSRARSTNAVTVGAFSSRWISVGGKAAVVVDHRVTELPAHAHALLGAGAVTLAGHRVSGPREPGQALGVHLQQVTGAWPLESPDRFARRAGQAAHLPADQAPRNGRVRHAQLGRNQPRAPAGPLARLTDPIMDLLADPGGLAVRRRRPIVGPRPRRPIGVRRGAVAPDPVLHR